MSVPAQAARTRPGGSDADRHGLLERGRNCDAIRHANRFSTLIDGAAGFAQVEILLASFDTGRCRSSCSATSTNGSPAPRAGEPLPARARAAHFPTLSPLFALDRIWIHPGELLLDVAVHRSAHARPTSDHYLLVARMRVTGGAGMKIAN